MAGTDKDVSFVQGSSTHQGLMIVNSLVHVSPTAENVSLTCTGFFNSGSLSQVRVTAIQVGSIKSTP